MSELTHFNDKGEAHMVDVSNKSPTHRVAIASGQIEMRAETLQMILEGKHKKGDVLGIARIAGIMAAKKTADLIPLCHPIMLSHISIEFESTESGINCEARVETTGQTGVEMEALTAVQKALLTIYDMCKAIDRGMQMTETGLVHKGGGKSGEWNKNEGQA